MEERLRSEHDFTEIRPFDLNILRYICQVKLACALKSLLNCSYENIITGTIDLPFRLG